MHVVKAGSFWMVRDRKRRSDFGCRAGGRSSLPRPWSGVLGAELQFQIQSTRYGAQPFEEGGKIWQELFGIFQDGDLEIRAGHQLALGVRQTMRGSRTGSFIDHSHFTKHIPFAKLSESDRVGVVTNGDVNLAFENSIGLETAVSLLKNHFSGFESGGFHLKNNLLIFNVSCD